MAEKDPSVLGLLALVRAQMATWPAIRWDADRVIVPTQCLFGSGGIVRVAVEGGTTEFVVHDDGAAIDAFSNCGGVNPKAIQALRSHFKEQGILVTDRGEITSPKVAAEALAPTIALIANASREAEDLLVSRWKPRIRRNFKRLLREMIEAEFAHMKPDFRLVGSSQKQHVFDFALDKSGGGLVLVDAVNNDGNAISSAVVRNLDIREAKREDVEQRIIIDDAEEWRAQDINLLALGATVIPFSRASSVLTRLAA